MLADLVPIYFVHGLVRDGVYPYFSDHKMGVVTNFKEERDDCHWRGGLPLYSYDISSTFLLYFHCISIFPVHSYDIPIAFWFLLFFIPIAFPLHWYSHSIPMMFQLHSSIFPFYSQPMAYAHCIPMIFP